jgi:flagellar motor switch protein FliM
MGEVLTQEEVDALLSGLTGGEVKAGTDQPAEPGSYVPYDFMNQDRIVRGRMPMLEMLHERFCRLFRQSISAAMQRVVDVTMLNLDRSRFGEFMRGLSAPSSLNIFRLEPLPGYGLLVLEGKLVFTMVNNFFGGRGTWYYKMEKPDFTPIEQRLIKTMVELILKDYDQVWQPVHKIAVSLARTEVNPQFVSIVPDGDGVVVAEIEISFEDVSEKMYFCLPYSSLDPIKDKLKTPYQSEALENMHAWANQIKNHLGEVPLEVAVRLGTAEITGRDVLSYKVGDIIPLRERSTEPVDIFVEDVLKLRGFVGSSRGCKAVKICQRVSPRKV